MAGTTSPPLLSGGVDCVDRRRRAFLGGEEAHEPGEQEHEDDQDQPGDNALRWGEERRVSLSDQQTLLLLRGVPLLQPRVPPPP